MADSQKARQLTHMILILLCRAASIPQGNVKPITGTILKEYPVYPAQWVKCGKNNRLPQDEKGKLSEYSGLTMIYSLNFKVILSLS